MRGIPSLITTYRSQVFREVAKMAYRNEGYKGAEEIPYIVVPGDKPIHRESIFLERAIVEERVRMAMGLSMRPVQTRTLVTDGMDQAAIAEQYYEPPLISIIPFACHDCPPNQYSVTESCQSCLAASCQKVCPVGAIEVDRPNKSWTINREDCTKCGACIAKCPKKCLYMGSPSCDA